MSDIYQGPFGRYASKEMSFIFSARNRFSTWRLLWLWLAESEKELGLPISDEAIAQMKAHVTIQDDEFEIARVEEKRRRHDVMAHVHTFGIAAPAAAGILHLGATSAFITDNADLIFMRDGLNLLKPKLANIIHKVASFARKYKDLATLSYTHGQPASATTCGKRAAVYCEDLLMDLENMETAHGRLLNRFRGVKGTTGTQASFLQLFHGDHNKVKALDVEVTKRASFTAASIITTQTYSRKIDIEIIKELSSFGATCERIGGDIRRLCAISEWAEPFEDEQIGTAMAYKRNPMRSERLCSLGRKLQNLVSDTMATYAAQWFERSLDDSAIRRIAIPESFLAADACCSILDNIFDGLIVYPAVIGRRLQDELPFMATENIIMALSSHGVSRQDAHEEIRVLSHQAAHEVKFHGRSNDLIQRIQQTEFFSPITKDGELEKLLDPSTFIGRAPQQVDEFLVVVQQRLEQYEKAGLIKAGAAELIV